MSFFTRVLPPLFIVILLLTQFLIAGRFTLRRLFSLQFEALGKEAIVSMSVGACAWILLLWIGAVFGTYTMAFGWILFAALPILAYRDTLYWFERFFHAEWEIDTKWMTVHTFLFWLVLSYLALNYINVVRPFPIGWDDLGSYLNRPRLLVSYGSFVFSMATFQWEYLTSLGFLLFGYSSTFGATTALVINWAQGLMALLTVYLFTRTFLGKGSGVLSALLYYTLPLVGHFSFADMKIDNAVFTMGAMAMFCVFIALFTEHEEKKTQYRWIALAGVLTAFAFSFKATAIMVFMALGSVLLGAMLHWTAFIGALFFVVAVFILQGILQLPALFERLGYSYNDSEMVFVATLLLVGVCFLLFAMSKAKQNTARTSSVVGIFVAAFLVVIAPWIVHNNISYGNSIPRLELRAQNDITPQVDMFGNNPKADYVLPPELLVDQSHPACRPSGGKEELGRYWGYRQGWGHYLTLPFRSVMNLDSSGYYVTTQPALLLFPLLLLLPFFWRKDARWLRWLWVSTGFLVLQWMFLANGIPWYGIGMFLGLVICLEVLIAKAPDMLSRSAAVFLVTLSLVSCYGMRFWQYDMQKNLFEYPMGKISAESIRERTIPFYDDITDVVLERAKQMPERPLMFRVGTFMPYFVPRNLEIIGVSDHQLDFFNGLYQDRDNVKTAARLKALGFNNIVFDTNTATIEKDPNGSLHKKVQSFVDFLNHPDSGLQVLIYNPSAGISFIIIP